MHANRWMHGLNSTTLLSMPPVFELLGRRHASPCQPAAAPICRTRSGQILTKAFSVPTSSALNVNSSAPSLMLRMVLMFYSCCHQLGFKKFVRTCFSKCHAMLARDSCHGLSSPCPRLSRLAFVPPSSEQASSDARFFWFPVWRSRRGSGSRRMSGRRRKARLEPDVRSSRFVIAREIPNATPFRVATFTRTTPPFHKIAKRDAFRTFSHRDACSEEGSAEVSAYLGFLFLRVSPIRSSASRYDHCSRPRAIQHLCRLAQR